MDLTLKVVNNVLERIEEPSNWTKYTMARDKFGNDTQPHYSNAVSWCLVGAFVKEVGGFKLTKIIPKVEKEHRKFWKERNVPDPLGTTWKSGPSYTNDVLGHEEVLNFLRWLVKKKTEESGSVKWT